MADIRQSDVDVLICLGDVVGYGPKPQEVLDGIRAVTDHFVLGNHDAAAAGIIDPTIFNNHAHAVILWTRESLTQESLRFLNEMPLVLEARGIFFLSMLKFLSQDALATFRMRPMPVRILR